MTGHQFASLFQSAAIACIALVMLAGGFGGAQASAANETERESPIPVLAYYYIWFDATSWNRAKTDYPIVGNYSSSDRAIMETHVRWAKDAGIDGFIVSWKSTPKLNTRLDQLIDIAEEEGFKLVMIYQGLDFERDPLTIDQIMADMDYFAVRWGSDRAFDLYSKPVIIWSGTWEFQPVEVAHVMRVVDDRLYVLASEKNLDGYDRLADLVDGNAYYWSSVDPNTYPNYPEKLVEMGEAIHDRGQIWIAPAAPGFDARLIGGTRVVEREDGETLQRQLEGALASAPDAVGLISWNEFSENSHIEPSRTHGDRYLQVLAEFLGARPPVIEFDSSSTVEAAPPPTSTSYAGPTLAMLGITLIASMAVILWRSRISSNLDRGEKAHQSVD